MCDLALVGDAWRLLALGASVGGLMGGLLSPLIIEWTHAALCARQTE